MVTENWTESIQGGRSGLSESVSQGKWQHSSIAESNGMKCKVVFRLVLTQVCSSVATHLRVFCRWRKMWPLLPGRTDRLWQSLLLKGRHTKTDAHTHTRRHALTFHNHKLLSRAPPHVCLSSYIFYDLLHSVNWHVLCVVIRNDKQTCKRVFFVFFVCILSGKSQSWAGRAWCECTTVSLSSPGSDTPLLQLKTAFIFHSAVPRQQRGGFPLKCQLRATGSSRSSLWPYYFHLLNTIRFPTQGGKEKKETKDHVVFVMLTLKQKLIFPHIFPPHCGVCYSVTTGWGHNLYYNNITLAFFVVASHPVQHFLMRQLFLKTYKWKYK